MVICLIKVINWEEHHHLLAVFCGNLAPAGGIGNVMEYVTIATTGNTTDFGDLTVNRAQACANSNVHGGLG